MKRTKKEPGKTIIKKAVKKIKPKIKKPAVKKIERTERLIQLLQVHQIELEHQNQELKIAQEELEVSRSKYVNLFDFSPIPYFTMDPDGVIEEVNLSASKMIGLERKKLIGRKITTYIPTDAREVFLSFMKDVFRYTEKQSCHLTVMNNDKSVLQVLLEGIKLEDTLEPGLKCQVALIDLTEYKNIEDSLKESNKKLKRLNSTKDKFFSIIAHDLRSPFQALLGYSEMLTSEFEASSKEEKIQFAWNINEILHNLYSHLENLLHWSMMQRDMLENNPENLNLSILITNNVDTETMVNADVDMLRSIVQNLISNAIKFTSTRGQIIISSENKGSLVEVSVKDNGIGIKPERRSELFDFISLYTTKGTTGETGTGLGLPLCKDFVERNGGNIRVESEVGKGTKFTFTLRKAIS